MAAEKVKSILPMDYDEEESEEEEEEDDELFDNSTVFFGMNYFENLFASKVDWRVKGNLLRGKEFSVSNDGKCPRCQSNVFVFVILDELFPMGDMPEILYNLLAKGKAVLWSSQDKQTCKKPPTFMCKGFCPPDPLGAGFNINWDTVNLTKVLKDLLRLNIAKAQKKMQLEAKGKPVVVPSTTIIFHIKGEGEEEDEEVDEKDLIRQMLAKEKEKAPEEKTSSTTTAATTTAETKTLSTTAKTSETTTTFYKTNTTTSTSSKTVTTTTTTSSSSASNVEYPVSKDGSCPYCYSKDVRYIILVKDANKDTSLPPTLESLLKQGKAFKMASGANSTPSFQCSSCSYGFNLDWSSTNLKKIFNLDKAGTTTATIAYAIPTVTSSVVTSSVAKATTSMPYQYPSYSSPTFQPTGYQNNPYMSYGPSQMYYPHHAMPYGYPPAPGYGMPPPPGMAPPGMPPMQIPPPGYPHVPRPPGYGPGPYRPPGMPPSYPPHMPPGNIPPPPYGAPYGQPFPGQRPRGMPGPRLRIPRMNARGRYSNKGHRHHQPKWEAHTKYYYDYENQENQWSHVYSEESEDTEGQHETGEQSQLEDTAENPASVVDPDAEMRFEELLNKIDGSTGESGGDEKNERYEEEKPPGEEGNAEFEVADYSLTSTNTSAENEKPSDVPPGTEDDVENMDEVPEKKSPEKESEERKSPEKLSSETKAPNKDEDISSTSTNEERQSGMTSEQESESVTVSRKSATRGGKRGAAKRRGGGTRGGRRKRGVKESVEDKVGEEADENEGVKEDGSRTITGAESANMKDATEPESEQEVGTTEVTENVEEDTKGRRRSGNTGRRGRRKKIEDEAEVDNAQEATQGIGSENAEDTTENEGERKEVETAEAEDKIRKNVRGSLRGKRRGGGNTRGRRGKKMGKEPVPESEMIESELNESMKEDVVLKDRNNDVEVKNAVVHETVPEQEETKVETAPTKGKRRSGNTRGRPKKQKVVNEHVDCTETLQGDVSMETDDHATTADSMTENDDATTKDIEESKEVTLPGKRVTRARARKT